METIQVILDELSKQEYELIEKVNQQVSSDQKQIAEEYKNIRSRARCILIAQRSDGTLQVCT